MKVHFAGLENLDSAAVLRDISGIRYALFTVFPYIARDFGISPFMMYKNNEFAGTWLDRHYKHVIMDSGLFTLMFGAHAGKRDQQFVDKWQEAIISKVRETGYKGAVVEVDCQKILGVDHAWKLRQELKDSLPNEQINVFHLEDGEKGLDRLIEFSDYIAISVPEFRNKGVKNLADNVAKMSGYIKTKKPEIKIHLLGCTQQDICKRTNFCDSCDSTSWQQPLKYPALKIVDNGKSRQVSRSSFARSASKLSPQAEAVRAAYPTLRMGGATRLALVSYAGLLYRQMYEQSCGRQD